MKTFTYNNIQSIEQNLVTFIGALTGQMNLEIANLNCELQDLNIHGYSIEAFSHEVFAGFPLNTFVDSQSLLAKFNERSSGFDVTSALLGLNIKQTRKESNTKKFTYTKDESIEQNLVTFIASLTGQMDLEVASLKFELQDLHIHGYSIEAFAHELFESFPLSNFADSHSLLEKFNEQSSGYDIASILDKNIY